MNASPMNRLFGKPVAAPLAIGALTDFADFVEAGAKRQQAREARVAIETALKAAHAEIAAGRPDPDDLDAEALAKFEDRAFVPSVDAQAEVVRLNRALEIARRVERLAKAKFDETRAARSAELCRAVAPRHRQLVREIAGRLALLSEACAAEVALRDELAAAGIGLFDYLLPAMAFAPAATPGWGRDTPAQTWLANARRLGFVAEDETLEDLAREVSR